MLNHPAKHDGPETSHLSADYIVSSGVQGDQQSQVLAAVLLWPGRTSYELARELDCERVMTARRLPELERAGKVVTGRTRACSISGRQAMVWHLMPEPDDEGPPNPQQSELFRRVA